MRPCDCITNAVKHPRRMITYSRHVGREIEMPPGKAAIDEIAESAVHHLGVGAIDRQGRLEPRDPARSLKIMERRHRGSRPRRSRSAADRKFLGKLKAATEAAAS
jgi:hypothetical protein